jgi:DNA polymerase/3'-5' exonuclease PolX
MKQRFPVHIADEVFIDIWKHLEGHCDRLTAAGSLRRNLAFVGDLEVFFINKLGRIPNEGDLFGGTTEGEITSPRIEELITSGVLKKRENSKGHTAYGESIKLTVHVASGLPVDFFTATHENWVNYLFCRTGGEMTNKMIASAAHKQNLKWCPYSPGFVRLPHEKWDDAPSKDRLTVRSEQALYELVKLPYKEPWDRE